MVYLITFLEGFISFISPCMLPMLPVYITYFAGNSNKRHYTLFRALFFVIGFTAVFSLMGLFAGTLGAFLNEYKTAVNITGGVIVILFGLSYLEVFHIPLLSGINKKPKINGILSAFLFGVIYSVSLTPCVGAFLGSALMMASSVGTAAHGALLLFVYSIGMGIPFLISAVLIEKLGTAFRFIKKNYKTINTICGLFLIITGLAMAFGLIGKLMSIFS